MTTPFPRTVHVVAAAPPVGALHYRATEPVVVGEAYVRAGDVVALLDGPHVALVADAWTPTAQLGDLGRVVLELVADPQVIRGPGARLVPVVPTSTLTMTPARPRASSPPVRLTR